jgi:hypothetical protein
MDDCQIYPQMLVITGVHPPCHFAPPQKAEHARLKKIRDLPLWYMMGLMHACMGTGILHNLMH